MGYLLFSSLLFLIIFFCGGRSKLNNQGLIKNWKTGGLQNYVWRKSSFLEVFMRKAILKRLTKLTRKDLPLSFFPHKYTTACRNTIYKKKQTRSQVPPQIFCNIFRTPFLNNTSTWLICLNKIYFYFESFKFYFKLFTHYLRWKTFPANIYLLKVKKRNSRKRCEIFSKITIKT